MEKELEKIVTPLLQWYETNKRSLPWRNDKNPYHIWISEIMLQQTRIEAVKSYYARFMKELPDIESLANIEEEKLLKLWEGLGYYNRARNLKKSAQKIQESYQGKMPTTYEELIKLPGIGEYTAGAIASIAYSEKIPAVDGNVLRVLSRIIASKKDILLPETKKEIASLIKQIMPNEAGNFNEALMELGELICVPKREPNCYNCPLQAYCKAYKNHLIEEIPVRQKKIKRKEEEKTVLVLLDKTGKLAIQKRQTQGVLKGMYEFPNLPQKLSKNEISKTIKFWNLEAEDIKELGEYKHIFTHIDWQMIGYQVRVKKINTTFLWKTLEEVENKYAIPTAFKQFLKRMEKE